MDNDNEDFIPEAELVQIEEGHRELEPLDKMPRGDKAALVRFDGTVVTEQGNLVKHNWFAGIDIDSAAYSDIELTPTEARQLRTAHQRMKTGASASTILTCYGPNICPMAKTCAYVRIQREIDERGEQRRVVPLGEKCPIEIGIMRNAVERLATEYEIFDGEQNYTDQRFALELAEIEVMENRINTVLATDPDLQGFTEEKLVSTTTTKDGDVIDNYVKDVADLIKIREKLWSRKDKIRKELVGTRYEQRRMAAKERDSVVDRSVEMAEILRRQRELLALVGKDD